jgi:DNA-binding LytR/AlgR family response regulator
MEPILKALIVDDEVRARKLLERLLKDTKYFNEIRLSQSVSSANNELAKFEPDLIFLDIKMPGKEGFSLIDDLSRLNSAPGIVFVTAYDQYAIKAIKNGAFDYLLKPVDREELMKCVVRFAESRNGSQLPEMQKKSIETTDTITRLRVNTRTGTVFINPDTILFCKADGNYTTISTGEKQHLCSMNLGKVGQFLNGKKFIRIGRSHIINFEFITLLDRKLSTITLVREGESETIKLPRQHLKDLDIF